MTQRIPSSLEEGWYLMSTEDLEVELSRRRDPSSDPPPSNTVRLEVDEALAYRNAGNLPDELGRSLRLVLHVEGPEDLAVLSRKRLRYEPDYHDAPVWRREGSRPVNVVPLRGAGVSGNARPWWDDPELGALEEEWRRRGTVSGMAVPGPYRSFVYKTVLSLQATGVAISVDAVADSISRWLPPEEAAEIRQALVRANRGAT